MFGLGKKYCHVCGMEVSKDNDLVRFGKSFCSEKHAKQYVEEQRKIEGLDRRVAANSRTSGTGSRGGCC